MKIKTEKLATPVKYCVTIDAEKLEDRKEKAYNKIKHNIHIAGFRKGNVPRNVAESNLEIEKLYKHMIDEIFNDIFFADTSIVETSNYKFFGDLKKKFPLTIEFIANVKPSVVLPDFNEVKKTISKKTISVTEEDIKNRITNEIKLSEEIKDTSKEVLENLDVAVIDFEGRIEGEEKPFKGGIAKGYQLRINEIVNGRKQFIDNFEDQLIGMKINETREVKVSFPSDYKEKSLASKKSIFVVTLKSIKTKITPEYNENFVKSKGFDNIKLYEEFLRDEILKSEIKKEDESFKKQVICNIVNSSVISPIPEIMIDRENEKEWNSFLKRLGQTEAQLEKERKITKNIFFENTTEKSIEVLKTSLVLEEIARKFNITVNEDEVAEHLMKVTNILKFSKDREEKVKEELKNNKGQFNLMKTATINEKVIDFLGNEFNK
ncbi:MAG: trigger factor [Candidatus Nanoarchaeia archaeon]|jgi:trigger factor|nr:trigger factor [Candidatus Nanoarchaeia archaeon]